MFIFWLSPPLRKVVPFFGASSKKRVLIFFHHLFLLLAPPRVPPSSPALRWSRCEFERWIASSFTDCWSSLRFARQKLALKWSMARVSSAPASSSPTTTTWTASARRSLLPSTAWTPLRPPPPCGRRQLYCCRHSMEIGELLCTSKLQWFGIEAINSSSLSEEAHHWCKPALIILGLSLP